MKTDELLDSIVEKAKNSDGGMTTSRWELGRVEQTRLKAITSESNRYTNKGVKTKITEGRRNSM